MFFGGRDQAGYQPLFVGRDGQPLDQRVRPIGIDRAHLPISVRVGPPLSGSFGVAQQGRAVRLEGGREGIVGREDDAAPGENFVPELIGGGDMGQATGPDVAEDVAIAGLDDATPSDVGKDAKVLQNAAAPVLGNEWPPVAVLLLDLTLGAYLGPGLGLLPEAANLFERILPEHRRRTR